VETKLPKIRDASVIFKETAQSKKSPNLVTLLIVPDFEQEPQWRETNFLRKKFLQCYKSLQTFLQPSTFFLRKTKFESWRINFFVPIAKLTAGKSTPR
jgi:hypothetical protein